MERRQYCASCRHIMAERTGDGQVLFRCVRLGYRTEPTWRFDCWQERPAGTPIPLHPHLPRREAD